MTGSDEQPLIGAPSLGHPPAADEIRCTVDGCTWSHTVRRIDGRIDDGTLAQVFGPGVFASVAQASVLDEAERAVAAHVRTHEPPEWLRTIARLRALLVTLGVDPDPQDDATAGIPVQLLLAGPGDLLDLAEQYGVEASPGDQVADVARRIVEAARAEG